MKFSPEGAVYLQAHPDECMPVLLKLMDPVAGFREFLNHWQFVDKDTGKVRVLGQILWAGQEVYVKEMSDPLAWLFLLKARQLGLSTLECAYDGYCARFRPAPGEDLGGASPYGENAVVHIFSKREKDAQALLAQVKYGLERLPEWMQLPVITNNAGEYVLDAGQNDERVLRAFPADNDTARSYTCTHAHLDEWAFMGDPGKVWQSVEPSSAGSVHFITTGGGPQNFSSQFFRRCEKAEVLDRRENPVKAVFLHALMRGDRTEKWLKSKAQGMTIEARMQELPMTAEEALSGGGDFVFRAVDINHVSEGCLGAMPGADGREVWNVAEGKVETKKTKYVQAWDIGRHKDAAVGITLDVTEDVHDVVAFDRTLELSYPTLQALIKRRWEEYGKPMVAIEKNGPGEAVAENLDIPERYIILFNTTKTSKARLISQLQLATQQQLLKWDPVEWPILDSEIRGYQLPDEHLQQDTVMSLGIAEEHAPAAYTEGRVLGVIEV